jgi:hypothetical protein
MFCVLNSRFDAQVALPCRLTRLQKKPISHFRLQINQQVAILIFEKMGFFYSLNVPVVAR